MPARALRRLSALLVAGVFAAVAVATVGESARADTNGTCYYYPSTPPTAPSGTAIFPACNSSRQLITTGGGSSGGSVTAAGTSGTSAGAVQGITGGVPLPSVLTTGASAIGTVGVTSLPSIPTGANTIGTVLLGVSNSNVGKVVVTTLPAIPTGANTIGNVGIIGTVTITGADGTAPVACKITSTSATTCSSPAGFFIGAISNSTAAQTASVACTWTGDGLVVPALGAGQIVSFEPNGPGYPTGATTASCTASATPVTTGTPTGGAGIVLLFR